MRLGCGCLIGALVVVVMVAGVGWITLELLRDPGTASPTTTAADAQHAQEKIYAIVTKSVPRGRSIVLSEPELNAFLSRNLDEAAEILSDLRVDLGDAPRVRIAGRAKLRGLLTEPPLDSLRELLPASWLGRPMWLEFTATPKVAAGEGRRRYLRLEVHEFRIGRQRFPAITARLFLDPGVVRLLRWPVPDTVEDVTIERGRVLVRTAS